MESAAQRIGRAAMNKQDLRSAFNGRSVFLTGHSGFKGSWLSLWLESMGAKVTGFSLGAPSDPDHFSNVRTHAKLEGRYFDGDIRNLESLKAVMAAAKPDIVFHLAAQPLVLRSYADPIETYSTNVMGTLNVFEACRMIGVQAIVNVTSDKCYENREWVWGYRENEAMGGHDPYSSSKGCAEILTASYRRSYFSKGSTMLASARAGNVIGGGDWAEARLIPDIVRATMKGETTMIRRPGSVRPWQHVLEPLYGYLMLGAKLLKGDASARQAADGWNFGPSLSDTRDVRSIAEQFSREWPRAKFDFARESSGEHEAGLLRLDITKATVELGWKPVLTSEESVRWTAEWYRNWCESPNGKECRMSMKQLEEFQSRL